MAEFAAADLDAAYDRDYYVSNQPEHAVGYRDYLADVERRLSGFRWRLDRIETRHPRPGRLLDYGCAVGLFVKVAMDAGWDAVGYERSRWAADYGNRHFGVSIRVGDADRAFDGEMPFDVVTLWDVLEHLESPDEILRWVRERLRPGGLLALNTVDAGSIGARLAGLRWRHLAPPHHLQYFTRRSLVQLLDRIGFDVVSIEAAGVMLAAKGTLSSLPGWARRLEQGVTHWRARTLATRANLLDEVEVMAVRR